MLDTEYNEAEVKELFVEEGRREGITGSVALLRSLDIDDATIVSKLMEQYELTEAEDKTYLHG